jgi:hypothetical protein
MNGLLYREISDQAPGGRKTTTKKWFAMNQPPLKMLHRDSFLSQVKLDQFAKM